jgi:hypothetical protein
MLGWCEKDLAASKATWKIVFTHIPAYDLGSHGSRWGHRDYLPIFRKHGVDLVLAGHTHSYQRFRPLFTKGVNESHPTTYVTTAGGGAPLHALVRDSALAAGAAEYHYMVFSVDDGRLTARAISSEGRQLDRFEIVKKDGKLDAAYLKSAIPEDDFDAVRKLVRPCLRGITMPREIRAGGAVKARFKLAAGEKAARYIVAIDPRASRNYELPEVSGNIPAGGAADVALSIKLKEAAPYRDGKAPLPPLMIECVVEIDGWRTGMLTMVREEKAAAPQPEDGD